jgi:hypothetical protein
LRNVSEQDIVAELILYFPAGFMVGVASADQVGNELEPRVREATRTGPNTWAVKVAKDAEAQDDKDYLYIAIAADDNLDPGFYFIEGGITRIEF